MARPRAYNHDIRCPHCGSNWTPKDGRSRVGSRDMETFVRLLSRLPKSERCRSDGYEAYGWLPTGSREVGKGSEANRNEGLHSVSRGS